MERGMERYKNCHRRWEGRLSRNMGKAEQLRLQERCSDIRTLCVSAMRCKVKKSLIRILRKEVAFANPDTLYLQTYPEKGNGNTGTLGTKVKPAYQVAVRGMSPSANSTGNSIREEGFISFSFSKISVPT